MPQRVAGTPAPDQVALRRLAEASGTPFARLEGRPVDRRLSALAAAAGGQCVLLPEVWCPASDWRALDALAVDTAAAGDALVPHRTRKRLQVFGEDLAASQIFPALIARMLSAAGGLSLVDSWVNVYRDGKESTGWHQDHYNLRRPHACATLNLNLGATRDLALEHIATGERFRVPQENGSLFAFDARFNAAFKHAVPPDPKLLAEPRSLRLSITVFAIEGPQPSAVLRDADNVPPGVPLTASWEGWDFQDGGWSPRESLQPGEGARRLLESGGPLLRGHERHNRGSTGARGAAGPSAGAAATADPAVAKVAGDEPPQSQTRRRWGPRRGQQPAADLPVADPGERRRDADGKAYTKSEFRRFYGGYREWDSADRIA